MLDVIIVALLASAIVMLLLNRAIKIEVKHVTESITRSIYIDETPVKNPVTDKPIQPGDQEEIDKFYNDQKEPMQEIMNMINGIGGNTDGSKANDSNKPK